MMRIKKYIILSLFLLVSVSGFAFQENETPKTILFFGRFHPVLLHLPIGALLLTFFIDVIGRIRKDYPDEMITKALGFSAFFTVLTAGLGYFLSLEGGYGEDALQVHMIGGFIMAGLTILLYIVKKTKKITLSKFYMPLFLIVLLVTTVTGHYGSVLTHGETFLTTYSPISFEEDDFEVITEKDSLYYYKHVITPILEDKCIQCHNDNKTKGDLNLNSVAHIMEGGENGAVLKAGNPKESHLFSSLLLPIEEDEHMPPSGKPQLTPKEIWLIENWIKTGAEFEKQIANYTKNDTLNNLLGDYLIFPKKIVPEADFKTIQKITENGFVVNKIVFGEPYLRVTFTSLNQTLSKKGMKSLGAISEQLVELNLQESQLTDALSPYLKKLTNLKKLRIDGNEISDETLSHLKELGSIESLNIFNTNISNAGLSELLNYITPGKVVFGNEIQPVDNTLATFDQTEVLQGIKEGFIEKSKLRSPTIVGKKSIFNDEIQVEIIGGIKNEAIYYTLDGTDPTENSLVYTEPIIIKESKELKVKSFKEGWFSSDVIVQQYNKIKYKIADISVKFPPEKAYPGIHKLFDFEKGSGNFRDGKWNGYQKDFIATIDMGKEVDVDKLSISCLEGVGSYIFFPASIEIHGGNTTDQMRKLKQMKLPPTDRNRDIKLKNYKIDVEPVKVRYIKVVLKNIGKLPKWHEGAGSDAWLFVDEIMVL